MNEIADELQLSKGSVHKIIKEWRSSPDAADIDDIRTFMGEIRKSGTNITECVEGFRILNILKKFGVYDEFDEEEEEEEEEETPSFQMQTEHRNIEEAADEFKDNNKDDQEEIIKHPNSKNKSSPDLLDLIRSDSPIREADIPATYYSTDLTKKTKPSNSKRYQIIYFINAIYKNCKNHGISPTIIVEWIEDLFYSFSILQGQSPKEKTINYYSHQGQNLIKSNQNGIPKEELLDIKINDKIPLLSRISFFIEQKIKEIHHLVIKRNSIAEEINSLNEQNNKVQTQLSNTIDKEKKAISYLQWYSNLREDLRNRFDLVIEAEFEAFANVINDFKEYGHNTSLLLKNTKNLNH
ncbi:MAG TPA: hypothetical protein VFT71_08010 [Candidatus Nitrosocosmicus sp.]|nr:hypothetical protein [Candidatus Nitrosocosmicus sp.]